ncbi:MAG: flagellar hook-basal body complex protein FliE [Candidatus Sericytochromatia bacterium]|nr:flagellar hook-basal body complex protein FliE [Candidatus Sericytochromatia bacterium]
MIQGISSGTPTDPFKLFEREFTAPLNRVRQSAPVMADGMPLDAAEGLGVTDGPTFGQVLQDALQSVEAEKAKAESLTLDFATGKPVDIHTMMIQVAKADVMMQVTSAVVSKSATSLNQLLQTQV